MDYTDTLALPVDVLVSLEDAALAVGRLAGVAELASRGLVELLVLRCASQASGTGREGMIALLRPEGERKLPVHRVLDEMRAPVDPAFGHHGPALLGAAHSARLAVLGMGTEAATAAAIAMTRTLCAGGAIGGPWLTLPAGPGSAIEVRADGRDSQASLEWLPHAFRSLEREARAAERGLGAARHRAAADEQRVQQALGRASFSAIGVLHLLRDRLILSVPEAADELALTAPTANSAMARLEEMGIVREVTGRQRSRRFVYMALVDALSP